MPAICLTCWVKALYTSRVSYGKQRPRITRPPLASTDAAISRDRAALPDSRWPEHREQVWAPLLDGPPPHRFHQRHLSVAPDERRGPCEPLGRLSDGTHRQPP